MEVTFALVQIKFDIGIDSIAAKILQKFRECIIIAMCKSLR